MMRIAVGAFLLAAFVTLLMAYVAALTAVVMFFGGSVEVGVIVSLAAILATPMCYMLGEVAIAEWRDSRGA